MTLSMAWSIIKPCQCDPVPLSPRLGVLSSKPRSRNRFEVSFCELGITVAQGVCLVTIVMKTAPRTQLLFVRAEYLMLSVQPNSFPIYSGQKSARRSAYMDKKTHQDTTHSDQRTTGKDKIHIDCWRRMTAVHQIPKMYCQGVVRQLQNSRIFSRNASRTLTSPSLAKAEGTDPSCIRHRSK